MRGRWLASFAASKPWRAVAANLVVLVSASSGLSCTREGQAPSVESVVPAWAYNDMATPLTIKGEGLRAGLALSAGSGAVNDQAGGLQGMLIRVEDGTTTALEKVIVSSATSLSANVPEGQKAGLYSLSFSDSRGHRLSLPEAFTSLGPDVDPPTIELVAPTAPDLFSEQPIVFRFVASDPTIPVTLNLSDDRSALRCLQTECEFRTTTPIVPENQASIGFAITARAQDGRGNPLVKTFPFLVIRRPHVDDISPRSGPVAGGTSIVIRGAFFPLDSQILVDGVPLVPDGGEKATDGTKIRGWTVPHASGIAKLKLRSVAGEVDLPSFTFNPAPVIKLAVPPTLPTTGCHEVSLVGNNLPAEGRWFMGRESGDRVPLAEPTFDGSSTVATFCVDAKIGSGAFSFFLDSASAGSVRFDHGFAFADPPEMGSYLPTCSCP